LLLIPLELFNSPENWGFIRLIFSFTITCREYLHTSCVGRQGYFNNNVVCIVGTLKNRSDLNWIFNTALLMEFLNDWRDFEWQVDILTNTIWHHFEKTVWWNECNRSISIKPSQSNTLVKLNVIYLNSFLLLLGILSLSGCWFLYRQFIINSKFTLWHAWQLWFHDNLADVDNIPINIMFGRCLVVWVQQIVNFIIVCIKLHVVLPLHSIRYWDPISVLIVPVYIKYLLLLMVGLVDDISLHLQYVVTYHTF